MSQLWGHVKEPSNCGKLRVARKIRVFIFLPSLMEASRAAWCGAPLEVKEGTISGARVQSALRLQCWIGPAKRPLPLPFTWVRPEPHIRTKRVLRFPPQCHISYRWDHYLVPSRVDVFSGVLCPRYRLSPGTFGYDFTFMYIQFQVSLLHLIWYDIDIFVNCNWVDTRWQQYSTHLHTNSTQNDIMKQNTQNGTYITIRIYNLQNQTEAHKTHNHIHNDTK
jgi:hypothetical protein